MAWADHNARTQRQPDAVLPNYVDDKERKFFERDNAVKRAVRADFAMPDNSDKTGRGMSALAGVGEYGTFFFGDELAGVVDGVTSGGHPFTEAGRKRFAKNYREGTDRAREVFGKSAADNPYTHHGSGIATALSHIIRDPRLALLFPGGQTVSKAAGAVTQTTGRAVNAVTPKAIKNIAHNLGRTPGLGAIGRLGGNVLGAMSRGAQAGAELGRGRWCR